jgi:hypothetical protein
MKQLYGARVGEDGIFIHAETIREIGDSEGEMGVIPVAQRRFTPLTHIMYYLNKGTFDETTDTNEKR